MPKKRAPQVAQPVHHVEHLVLTYAVLMHAARALVPDPEPRETPSCLAAGILCAFALEAYLNHVGALKLHTWESVERIGPKEKLEVLEELCSFSVDRAGPIYEAFTELFAFRNAVAHGRNDAWIEINDPVKLIEAAFTGVRPRAHWEVRCSPAKIRTWLEHAEALMRAVHSAAGLKGDAPWSADPLATTYTGTFRIGAPRPGLKVRHRKG